MKKITSILLALALMVSLLVAVPAMKAEALTDATTPYTDTFDGSKGGNYTAHGIFWNGVNGKLNVGYNAAQAAGITTT